MKTIRPEFFIFRFTDPPDPIFLKIEEKNKFRFFFNFIFVIPPDSCHYSSGVKLCFSVFVF